MHQDGSFGGPQSGSVVPLSGTTGTILSCCVRDNIVASTGQLGEGGGASREKYKLHSCLDPGVPGGETWGGALVSPLPRLVERGFAPQPYNGMTRMAGQIKPTASCFAKGRVLF